MNQAETAAFVELNAKVEAVVSAVTSLTTEIASERKQLSDAMSNNDTAGVLAAAKALSDKLDGAIASAAVTVAPLPSV